MTRWLIDTGPLVAYVDGDDRAHELVVRHLDVFVGRLHTTTAVVTEAMHFVARDPDGPRALAGFLAATRTEVDGTAGPRDLQLAVDLMEKYRDTPMDYADATLVLLAQRLGSAEIATLDRRGFSAYRQPGGKAFRLVLPKMP